jgi:hypothetical protein
LGEAIGSEVFIDANAAGYGWSLGSQVAPNKVDLLTVVEHELGHVLGLPDIDSTAHSAVDDPGKAAEVLQAAFACQGPAVVEAVVDPNEPALPGHVSMDQAMRFAKALARGQKDGLAILKDVLKEQIREVV